MLADDTIIDCIFVHLPVKDILAMRAVCRLSHLRHILRLHTHPATQVSKLFYALSHHPAIWKRMLVNCATPLPPLPPTRMHSLGKLSAFESERLTIRALSFDKNWRSESPIPFRHRAIESKEGDCVLEMALVPGGHYMVASQAPYGKYFHRLTLYTLDNKAGACIPIAEMRTGTKAYGVQARYTAYKGQQGIMISYTRRCLTSARDCGKGYVNFWSRTKHAPNIHTASIRPHFMATRTSNPMYRSATRQTSCMFRSTPSKRS